MDDDPLFDAIVNGRVKETERWVAAAISASVPAEKILNDSLIAAMTEVSERFEDCSFFLPDMLVAARAMQTALAVLRPQLQTVGARAVGKIVLGTVQGDIHDIGKNLVGMMLEGAGFDVVDLGTGVKAESFVEAVKTQHPDLLGMSALLSSTRGQMALVIRALDAAGLREKVKVIVGGAPVTEGFAREIGADGYAPDASRAARLAKSLVRST